MNSQQKKQSNLSTNSINRLTGNVIREYMFYLTSICSRILSKPDEKEMNTRKYEQIRKEIFNFLVKHKDFLELKRTRFTHPEGSSDCKIILNSSNCEDFLKLEDFKTCIKKMQDFSKIYIGSITLSYEVVYNQLNIVSKIECVLGRQPITLDDIEKFSETNLLVEKSDLNTDISNYEDLTSYIGSRLEDFYHKRLSQKRIEELSFNFKTAEENSENKESCGICLEDYSEDQQVCKLPCGHLLCRPCSEKWFKDSSQCPICRDDCT